MNEHIYNQKTTDEKIGFSFVHSTEPNYWYINEKKLDCRIHRFVFRKSELKKKLDLFDPKLSEWQNMQLNGYTRIWDCGNLKYEMNFKILYEIISKQKNISTSIETKGLFVFETYNNFEVENIVIFCDEKNFYINSFFQRRLFKKNSSSLFQLKELLNIKINEYKKQL